MASSAKRFFIRHRSLQTACIRIILAPGALGLTANARAGEASRQVSSLAPSAAEVTIVSTEFKFARPSGRIVAGQPFTLILDNSQAETEHGIFVPAFGLRMFANAGQIVRKTVVLDKAGEFEFVCDLPGHHEAGMEGKLIVSARDNRQVLGSATK